MNKELKDKKKKVVLFIDTASNQEIVVGLTIDGKAYELRNKIDRQKAQVVLPMIDQLLKESQLTLQDLTALEVATGPGSFTGLRVGVAIANALAYVLNIPINNKEIGEYVEPVYT